jgi:hypothetical protein
MLHLVHHRALQPDEVAGEAVVEDLAASIVQQLVAEGAAGKHGIEVSAAGAFEEKHRARSDGQLARLEGFDELELFGGEGPEHLLAAQRTAFARYLAPRGSLGLRRRFRSFVTRRHQPSAAPDVFQGWSFRDLQNYLAGSS